MLAHSTNHLKPNNRLPHPELHAKILNLVANRMQPNSSGLNLQKQACGSCVTPSPSGSTKRNSLTGTRANESKEQINQTMCEGSTSHYQRQERTDKAQVSKSRSSSHLPPNSNLTRQLITKYKKKLQLDSKVVFLSIDHAKIGDFTIDLRREIPTEFVNIKMMNKLRLENAEKQRRITQLESQVLELHDRIIEMSLSLEQKDKGTFSEISIPASASINKISEINGVGIGKNGEGKGNNEEWGSLGKFSLPSNLNQTQMQQNGERQENQYDYLLRMLKIQANQIEKHNKLTSNIQHRQDRSQRPRQRSIY